MQTVVGCRLLVVGCLDLILMDSASRAESQIPTLFAKNAKKDGAPGVKWPAV